MNIVALETLAVSMYESHIRATALRTIDWFNLTRDARNLWRKRAKSMVEEAGERNADDDL